MPTSGQPNYTLISPDDDLSTPDRRIPYKKRLRVRNILCASVAIVLGTYFLFTALNGYIHLEQIDSPRNVIMMISDGFGPASETYARQYHGWREGLPYKAMLPLDRIHVGHSRTQSASSLITDSAAGATAFSCGLKSYNGAIGVDAEKMPCGTVLESAKLRHGMLTGLVATSRITHATPASFSAHVTWRDDENDIAEQQIGHNPLGRTVDLMFGGGECEFLSNATATSCRLDGRDLLQEAQEQFGWTVKRSREDFDLIHPTKHMNYEIDRDPDQQPSLKEMAEKALAVLSAQSKANNKGFFLMIEGSRIDMAAHTNDPAAHFHDIWEYHQTAEVVMKFVREHPNTVVISTSDHETGGLTVGRQIGEDYPEYKWNPEVISRVRNSSEILARAYRQALETSPDESTRILKEELIREGLGITDVSEEELEAFTSWMGSGKSIYDLESMFGHLVSRRALIGWTTHGHTAVDVNLYAFGAHADALRGSHENTDVGEFIAEFLDLDLEDVTHQLNEKKNTFKVLDTTNRMSKHQMRYD
ncbi:alkaline-phosphatase-like protein [Dichotomocladium elegans]|nr:alkaline-phosphatase-like protein [Dichotomocladium elegans]